MTEPETAEERIPPRRVTLTLTAYLTGRMGGFYDMASRPDGDGETWSIPESAVDEDSVRDAPPERLSADDWSEIYGTVTARYGKDLAARILAEWRTIATAVDERRARR